MKKLLGAIALLTLSPMLATNASAQEPSGWPDNSFGSQMGASGKPALPLFSISLEAAAQTVNRYSVDVSAVFNTWTVNKDYEPSFSSRRVDFSVQPGQKDAIVMKSLEMKEAPTPQALLDKMLIDGALTLNMTW